MDDDAGPSKPLLLAPNAVVTGEVEMGEEVSIWFGAVVRGDRDRIRIGVGTNVQDNAVIHTSAGFPVEIGSFVSVGHGAILHGCTIGDRVLVGMGAIVMNGAIVGEGSIVGAGAVITEHTMVPPHSVVLGVPAKVIRTTTEKEQEYIVRNARGYIELAKSYRGR